VSEWFEQWFGEAYLDLYPHRDEAEAARAVRLLAREGVVGPGRRVLDLACGAGRHATVLADAGAAVTGLDLSMPLLQAAREHGVAALVRADMRALPLRGGVFDAVVNLFTSFGYFRTDAEHQAVLDDVARVLRPGGHFALDYLNAPVVRATLVPRDERVVGGRRIIQERRLSNSGTVVKTIHLADEGRSYLERVRLFERGDIERMLAAAGLAVGRVFGDYDGGAHTDASPRLILLARRA